MSPLDTTNVVLSLLAMALGGVLWWTLRTLRPWRRALVAHAPHAVSRPLACVAAELGMLPWVFICGAVTRLSTLLDHELLTVCMTGVTAAVTGMTLWHLLRAARCVSRAVNGEPSREQC